MTRAPSGVPTPRPPAARADTDQPGRIRAESARSRSGRRAAGAEVPTVPATGASAAADLAEIAATAGRVADLVRDHPEVVGLHPGPHRDVFTPLPGGGVVGVRASGPGHPVEIAVVLRLRLPLPEVAAQLRHRVRDAVGPVPVDVVVADVAADGGAGRATEGATGAATDVGAGGTADQRGRGRPATPVPGEDSA